MDSIPQPRNCGFELFDKFVTANAVIPGPRERGSELEIAGGEMEIAIGEVDLHQPVAGLAQGTGASEDQVQETKLNRIGQYDRNGRSRAA